MRTKLITTLLLTLIFMPSLWGQSAAYIQAYNESLERSEWMTEARFGMFIHFGAYSAAGRGEWVKNVEGLTNKEYQKYVDVFNPVDCDMNEWAKLAKEAGMKYAVMTAKHHDGFCLFNSKYTNYTTQETIGRDLVREFVEAFRAQGLKVGLYYSTIDWHHDDYPKFNDAHHPMRGREEFREEKVNWDNYLKYLHGQVNEITSNYGDLDVLWFDFSYDEMRGEKWESNKLVKMVRKNQPGIILNNRLQGAGHGILEERDFLLGDFDTPEQGIPDEELKDPYGNPLRWETCLTLNNNWGFQLTDNEWKTPATVIHALIDVVSKNGNLLLNVGPDGRGNIPGPSVEILREVGQWMRLNGESIYGSGRSELPPPQWGRFTQKGNRLYLHWMYPKVGPINFRGYADKTKRVTLLRNGVEAPNATSWWGSTGDDNFFINVDTPIYQTFTLPDPYSTVFELEMK